MLARMFTARHRGGSGEPMVLLHGFTDTWRTWELVLPTLEQHADVLAPTLLGHAGGPPIGADLTSGSIADAVERQMDDAGFETAHIVGNSLGGYVALQLAERGRARHVVALAPAGGWADGDEQYKETLAHFAELRPAIEAAAPHAASLMATPQGRRLATREMLVHYEHVPAELLVHQLVGAARCDALGPFTELALGHGWPLDAERIACPVRIVWGTEDQILEYPRATLRYRDALLPHADWVVLDDVGHLPQLDVPRETAQLILGATTGA